MTKIGWKWMDKLKSLFIILLVVAIIFSLSACGANVEDGREKEDEPSMFVLVEQVNVWSVVYHRETKVMYVVSGGMYNAGCFTVLVDADGNPMLWRGR